MFEEIAPGYYDKYYGLSSEFAHPSLSGYVFKINRREDGTGFADSGIVFKEDRLTSCFNETLILMLGLLRAIDLVFPKASFTVATVQLLIDAETTLKAGIESHIKFKDGPSDWHILSEPLWMPYEGDLATRLSTSNDRL